MVTAVVTNFWPSPSPSPKVNNPLREHHHIECCEPAHPTDKMSNVAYEPRSYMQDGSYPPMDDHHDPAPDDRFPDPNDPDVAELTSFGAGPPSSFADPQTRLDLEPPSLLKEDSPAAAPAAAPAASMPSRVKPNPKPEREIVKNAEGKYICTWPECPDGTKAFQRKCEWR